MTTWTCLDCDETGTTDKAAERHTRVTTHATMTRTAA